MSSTVNNIKVPARTGYTFLGYFDAVTGGNQVIDATGYIKSSVANTAFSSSRYLYAHWSANTYKLILNNEGADNPGSIAVYEKYDSGFYLNSACTSRFMLNGYSIRKISIPTKKGYTFAGYYESESSEDSDNKLVIRPNGCVNTSVIANNEYSDENFYDENTRYINLYAHWTENTSAYTISFYPNGGSGSMDSQGLLCNETKNLSACKFVRSGYSFKGWSYSPASAAVAFTDAQSVTGLSYTNGSVIRLYAVWAADDTEKYPYSYYLVNGSFETPDLSTVSWTNTLPYTTAGLGWLTTAKNKMIEIADVKYSASSCNNAYHTKNASDGNQFAELNANSVSSLYQLVSVPEACTMYYGFDHRGRYAADTMELWIGAPDDVNAVLSYYKSSGNSLKGLESADSELYDTYLSIKQISVTDDNSAWKSYSGSLELPESTSAEMFAFVATSASDGNLSSGNLIDNVYFTPTKPVSNYDYTVEATVGGSVDVLKEGVSEGSVVTYGTSYSGTVLKDQEIELAVNEAEGYSYNGALVDGTYYSAQDLACINGSLVWVAGASDSDSVSGTFTSAKKITVIFSKNATLNFAANGGMYHDTSIDLKSEYDNNSSYSYTLGEASYAGLKFTGWQVAGSSEIFISGDAIKYSETDGLAYITVTRNGSQVYEISADDGLTLIAMYDTYTISPLSVTFDFPKIAYKDISGNTTQDESITTYYTDADGSIFSDRSFVTYTLDECNTSIILGSCRKDGYTFKGWSYNDKIYETSDIITYRADYNSADYDTYSKVGSSGSEEKNIKSIVLSAAWDGNTVNIRYMDGSSTSESGADFTGNFDALSEYPVSHKNGTNTTLVNPQRVGYDFSGWYTDSAMTQAITVIPSLTAYTDTITVYAKWTPITYNITYAYVGNVFTFNKYFTAPSKHTYDTVTELPDSSNVTKKGYSFGGWYLDDALTQRVPENADGVQVLTERAYTDNITLYPKWTGNTYAVTLNDNGGSGGSGTVNAVYDAALSSVAIPVCKGKVFDGYFRVADDETSDKYYNADGSGNKIWDINKNTTLYACWSANKYQVNFDMDGITPSAYSASGLRQIKNQNLMTLQLTEI